jgi:hypothetical protein
MSRRYTVQLPSGQTFGPESLEGVERWAHQRRIPADAYLIPDDGSPAIPVSQQPTVWRAVCNPEDDGFGTPGEDDAFATIIPYRNPKALAAYYTGIASLVPLLGLIAGPVAIVLGVLGLRARKKDPRLKGSAHAITGIVLGSITTIVNFGFIVFRVIAVMA